MRVDFARLNHILIPDTKTGRDKFRQGRFAFLARPLERWYRGGTDVGRVLWVLWLIVGAFGLEVRENAVHILWCGLTGLLVAGWALRRFYALDEVSVRVEHAPRVREGERLDVTFVLENRGDRDHFAIAIDGPLLPWDGRYLSRQSGLQHLAAGATERAIIPLEFVARGEHHLDPFHVAATVTFGLTFGPTIETAGLRFLVLPRLAKIARLDLETTARHQPGGIALASQTGEARELIGLRPYRPGDPVRDLCHRAWARTGTPVVREYQQEYFTRLSLVLDTDLGAADRPTLEAAIRVAAGVLAHLVRGDVLVDLMIVGGELHRLTLGRSLGRLEQALDLLAVVEPGATFEAAPTLSLIAPHLDRLSSVVIVALADDPERRRVEAEIRRRGVGCRTIVIGQDVSVEAVEREEAITL
ncbi:MAG: DUF58 domain-containing protein [Deltaproteobacteria bacterium]